MSDSVGGDVVVDTGPSPHHAPTPVHTHTHTHAIPHTHRHSSLHAPPSLHEHTSLPADATSFVIYIHDVLPRNKLPLQVHISGAQITHHVKIALMKLVCGKHELLPTSSSNHDTNIPITSAHILNLIIYAHNIIRIKIPIIHANKMSVYKNKKNILTHRHPYKIIIIITNNINTQY